jgi:general secretion pathway protein B
MSYILDALKKSDHERKQGSIPSLQTVHIPASVEANAARWPYIVIALLMLSLAFVLGMLRPWEATSEGVVKVTPPILISPQKLVVIKPQPIQSYTKPTAVTPQLEPLFIERSPVISAITPPVNTVEQAPSLEMGSVPHLSEMPPLVQQAIPDMEFAGHVYSSDASQRSVIVNGHSMSEGEVVIEGLKVEQIIRNGVVFNYQGQLFRMEILQDWSFD